VIVDGLLGAVQVFDEGLQAALVLEDVAACSRARRRRSMRTPELRNDSSRRRLASDVVVELDVGEDGRAGLEADGRAGTVRGTDGAERREGLRLGDTPARTACRRDGWSGAGRRTGR
jgi:hypothetical protein